MNTTGFDVDAAFAALVADLNAWGDGVRAQREAERQGQAAPRVAAVVCGRAGLQVRVRCPYCGREHRHGITGGAGHRVAHCGRGGYVLAVSTTHTNGSEGKLSWHVSS